MAWLKKKRPITVHMRKYNAYLRRPRVTLIPIRAVAYLMRWNWPSDEAIFGSLLTVKSAWRRKPLAVVGVISSNHHKPGIEPSLYGLSAILPLRGLGKVL
jgi:hypothetical protein